MPDEADSEVIRRILNGDVNAYELLLKKYSSHVGRVVSRHVGADAVEEVAHDVFVRAFRSLHTFVLGRSFRNWLSTVAVRTCVEYWRREKRWRETPVSSLPFKGEATGAEWLEFLTADDARRGFVAEETRKMATEILAWALGKLSAEERMVLELYYLEGYSVREVGKLMGISRANVKVKTFRSRKKLRRIIEAIEQAEERERGVDYESKVS